eukprot:TRINITY_DN1280_c2_g1_i2.p1 TRINITY_DN1280_c2_g1~~TRINITY_DN1280_c2_g1_i2.p1  ORF type:complete len:395 (-),score=120.67 TRINITY_DN1280_c2_g1_i2:71-1255(-)
MRLPEGVIMTSDEYNNNNNIISGEDKECLADFLNNSYSPPDLKVKERIKPSKLVDRCLVTISESSEILYPLHFSNVSFMEQELKVPAPGPAVEGGERLSVISLGYESDEENDESSSGSSEMNDVSEELTALKDRAKKLSEELKMLTSSAYTREEEESEEEHISKERIRSLLNETPSPPMEVSNSSVKSNSGNNLFEEMKKRLHPVTVVSLPSVPMKVELVESPSFIRINADCYVMESDDESTEEEEEEEEEEEHEEMEEIQKTDVSEAKAFKSSSTRGASVSPVARLDFGGPRVRSGEEKPSFLDLSLEGEKALRVSKTGSKDWLMPFREKLYHESRRQGQEKEIDFTNPIFYAPTGDIYSYFQRRQLYPHPFKMPTQYQIKTVLSNRKKGQSH